ncbi:hypothetical protein [Thermostichus vulcanus]|uniref:Uncharacterized protein n=1 Tax=Thermostichus vulcanus str. 'Rupite' TaxID=2813851 RepID=A0ABT0CAU6_THEVL|nr:hypothetical protein [Thermostichus vulcanus]MCJ2542832.1 hypothetical protein [Thermostichus vulcanus str. 'Rupite']
MESSVLLALGYPTRQKPEEGWTSDNVQQIGGGKRARMPEFVQISLTS